MGEVAQLFEIKELTCNRCRLLLPISEFGKNNAKKRGYSYSCKKCLSQYKFSRYAAEGEAFLKNNTEYTCNKCGQVKPLSAFHKHSRKKFGIDKCCKTCQLPHRKVANLKFWEKNGGREGYKTDTWGFKKHYYGLTKERFFELLAEQSGSCAICKIKPQGEVSKVFHVDHNHKTGEVRGILCGRCNVGIGFLGDSITILKNAAAYLESRGSYGS